MFVFPMAAAHPENTKMNTPMNSAAAARTIFGVASTSLSDMLGKSYLHSRNMCKKLRHGVGRAKSGDWYLAVCKCFPAQDRIGGNAAGEELVQEDLGAEQCNESDLGDETIKFDSKTKKL